jgi:hypothetical protein
MESMTNVQKFSGLFYAFYLSYITNDQTLNLFYVFMVYLMMLPASSDSIALNCIGKGKVKVELLIKHCVLNMYEGWMYKIQVLLMSALVRW